MNQHGIISLAGALSLFASLRYLKYSTVSYMSVFVFAFFTFFAGFSADAFSGGDTTPPPVPADIEAVYSAGPGNVQLRWNPVVAEDLKGYEIYRSFGPEIVQPASTSISPVRATIIAEVYEAAFTDFGPFPPNTICTYSVCSVDLSDNRSPMSATASIRTPSEIYHITGLCALPGDEMADIWWNAVSPGSFIQYNIYSSLENIISVEGMAPCAILVNASDNNWRAEGLENGKPVWFAVGAVNLEQAQPGNFAIVKVTPFRVEEQEPNDGFITANEIISGRTFQAYLNPAGDSDYYKLYAPGPGGISVEIAEPLPAGLSKINIWAYDTKKQLVNLVYAPGGPKDPTSQKTAGNYWIQVCTSNSSEYSYDPYTITVTFHPPDLYEPNDAVENAFQLPSVSVVEHSLNPAGDIDWFSFDVSRKGILYLKRDAHSLSNKLTILGPDGTKVYSITYATSAINTKINLKNPGRYRILSEPQNADGWATAPFKMNLEVKLAESSEPNDTIQQATSIDIGNENSFAFDVFIMPATDVDYFSLNLEKDRYFIYLRRPDERSRFELYDGSGVLVSGPVSYASPWQWDIPEKGRYYLKVYGYNDSYYSEAPHTVKIIRNVPDLYEPNNTIYTATPIAVSAEIPEKIIHASLIAASGIDEDWYSIKSQTGFLHVLFELSPFRGAIVSVHDINGDQIWTANVAAGQSALWSSRETRTEKTEQGNQVSVATEDKQYFVRIRWLTTTAGTGGYRLRINGLEN